jgi:hypothetical protein
MQSVFNCVIFLTILNIIKPKKSSWIFKFVDREDFDCLPRLGEALCLEAI